MSSEFKREERYMVFKVSDVAEHLTATEALHLARLYEIQRVGRKEAGKAELECVVVEKDWPEYEPTWRAIEARTTGAQPAPSVPDGIILKSTRLLKRASGHLRWLKKDAYQWQCLNLKTKKAAELLHRDIDAMLAADPEAKP